MQSDNDDYDDDNSLMYVDYVDRYNDSQKQLRKEKTKVDLITSVLENTNNQLEEKSIKALKKIRRLIAKNKSTICALIIVSVIFIVVVIVETILIIFSITENKHITEIFNKEHLM